MEYVTGDDQCGVCGKAIGFSDDTIGMETCEVCIDCARKAIKFVNRIDNYLDRIFLPNDREGKEEQ